MAVSDFDERQREIQEYHKDYGWFYKILGGSILVLIGVWIGSQLFAGDSGYNTNLYTELLSIGVTVFILNELARRREVRQLQEQLIRNAASTSNEIAKDAVHQLRRQGWLEGEKGLLQGKKLQFASLSGAFMPNVNLSGAILGHADLSGANLSFANLSGARLSLANLSGANLWSAYLSGVIMQSADLSGANLSSANLSGVKLDHSNLSGARLSLADLSGATFERAAFDDNTILPDANNWTPDTDMERFTNPDHPNFWRHPWEGDSETAEDARA